MNPADREVTDRPGERFQRPEAALRDLVAIRQRDRRVVQADAGEHEVMHVYFGFVVEPAQALGADVQAGFLSHLTQRRFLPCFFRLAAPTREFPVQPAVGVVDEQDMALLVENHRRRPDQHSIPLPFPLAQPTAVGESPAP